MVSCYVIIEYIPCYGPIVENIVFDVGVKRLSYELSSYPKYVVTLGNFTELHWPSSLETRGSH